MSASAPTYAELKSDLRREVDSLALGPAEYLRLDEWLADADLEIQLHWEDWNFLIASASFSSIASTATYTLSSLSLDTTLSKWDRESFVWNPTDDAYQILTEMPYKEWRETARLGTVDTGTPENVVVKPNKDIVLYPTPDAIQTVTADYWTIPVRMSADADESAIPGRYRRVIVLRAALTAAAFKNSQNPDSIKHGRSMFQDFEQILSAQYKELLARLEGAELPDQSHRYRSQPDHDITVFPA